MVEEKKGAYDSDDDIEIEDPNSYGSWGESTYNHQALVMERIRYALECAGKEMRKGWINQRIDNQGNLQVTHVEDTRQSLINSVDALLVITSCDFDEVASKEIEDYETEEENIKNRYAQYQKTWWKSLNNLMRQKYLQQGIVPDVVSPDSLWYDKMLYEIVELRKKMLVSIVRLIKRLGFYKEEGYTG